MRLCALLIGLASLVSAVPAFGQPNTPGDTLYVADRFLTGPNQTGAHIFAKFTTASLRAETLRFDSPIIETLGRKWVLGDVLAAIDLNGNGFIAGWQVAGPEEVIEAHLAHIEEMARDRSKIYDGGPRRLVVRCACGAD